VFPLRYVLGFYIPEDYILLITTKLLDFVHHPDFHKPENTTFRKLDLFPSSGEGGGLTNKKQNSVALSPRANYTD
jgi:hypothetical protein